MLQNSMVVRRWLTENSESHGSSGTSAAKQSDDAHKNEGFLKSAWHKLTHQHDDLPPANSTTGPKVEDKSGEEESKKAAGSG